MLKCSFDVLFRSVANPSREFFDAPGVVGETANDVPKIKRGVTAAG